jgi:hypothetical protein
LKLTELINKNSICGTLLEALQTFLAQISYDAYFDFKALGFWV